MHCERFDDPGLFLEEAGSFLAEREAQNTVLVGAALRCRQQARPDAVTMAVYARGRVCLAAVMTPPFNLVLSAGGDLAALPVLGGALLEAGIAPPGVVGPRSLGEAFAEWWCRRRQTDAEPEHDLVLYRAERITPPAGAAGELWPAWKTTSSSWPTGMKGSSTTPVSVPAKRLVRASSWRRAWCVARCLCG